jgi:hypothetical protein
MTDKAIEIKQPRSFATQRQVFSMQLSVRVASLVLAFCAGLGVAHADNYADSISVFKKAGESSAFFRNSYAIAITASAGASVGTIGTTVSASGTENNATTAGRYISGCRESVR